MPNTSKETLLDSLLPNEILKIVFDQVVNQSQPLRDISSILLTCQKWKDILEENPASVPKNVLKRVYFVSLSG